MGDPTRAVTPSEHLSLDALQTLARAFGETTLTQKDALIAFLTQKATDHRRLLAEIDALRGASTRIDNMRGAARAAIEALEYDEAMRLLESARTIIREQLQEPIELNARLSERQAEIALIRGDTQTAFSLLSAAADSFAALDPVLSAQKRCDYALILYEHGLRYGGSGLAYAIKLGRAARETLTEADHPRDWARTTQNLGLALRVQGARTQGPAGTALLAEAVTCYRDALRVSTEADHPLDWATTTQNLANALRVQGARTQGPAGTALLADAVTCYRDALRVRTEADHPLDWAMTTQNLGNALRIQGARIQGPAGTALLAEAVTCYRDALRIFTEAEHPLDWAMTTQNLANALRVQGARTQGPAGTALLADAVTCYRDALRIFTEADHPLQWAMTTQNLAAALQTQGARTQSPAGTALLADAVTGYRDALRIFTEADHRLHWALTKENLALAETALADHATTDDPVPHLRAALTHVTAALTVFDPVHTSYDYKTASRLRDTLRDALGHAAEDYLQEEFSFEELKEIASERQGAGLGSEEEKAARGAVLTQIAALSRAQSVDRSMASENVFKIRQLTGYSWAKIGELLNVDRRTINNWAQGRPVHEANQSHVAMVLSAIRYIDRGDIEENQELLERRISGTRTAFQELAKGNAEGVRRKLSFGESNRLRPMSSDHSVQPFDGILLHDAADGTEALEPLSFEAKPTFSKKTLKRS
jgi:tetratricopeptide (TPR) repeat protein